MVTNRCRMKSIKNYLLSRPSIWYLERKDIKISSNSSFVITILDYARDTRYCGLRSCLKYIYVSLLVVSLTGSGSNEKLYILVQCGRVWLEKNNWYKISRLQKVIEYDRSLKKAESSCMLVSCLFNSISAPYISFYAEI